MLKFFKNSYVAFFLLVITIMLCIGWGLSWMTYKSLVQETSVELQIEANRIEHNLASHLDEIQSLMIYVGKRIAQEDGNDSQAIWEHMQDILGASQLSKKAWDWLSFSWTNEKNQGIVHNVYGILTKNPINLSVRKYIKTAHQIPWTLHLDSPATGIPSGKWSLNGGVGIEDEKGNFVGTLAVSFDLADLTRRIKQVLTNSNIEFVVLNDKQKLVMNSTFDQSLEPLFQTIAEKFQITMHPYHVIKNDNPIAMTYESHLSRFPLKIITYVKQEVLIREWKSLLIPHFLEILGIGLSCLLLLHIFWKRICKKNKELDVTKQKLEYVLALAKSSDAAKEEFLRCTNKEMMIPLSAIVNHIDILIKNLKHEMDIDLAWEKQIELLDEILNCALNFKNLTSNELDLGEVDLKTVIEECVIIHSKSAFEKNLIWSVDIPDGLPKLEADELKIKQIFVGLLSRAIKCSPALAKIEVIGSVQQIGREAYVKIIINDSGIRLSDELIHRISESLESMFEKANQIDIEFPSIERLVHMHQGICHIENDKGTSITLLFPVKQPSLIRAEKKKNSLSFSFT